MKSNVEFAILAPVPAEHLESGIAVSVEQGFVAFGSLKWDFFPKVNELRGDEPVPVLIYPSAEEDQPNLTYVIKWVGWYVGHVKSDIGAHPEGTKHRPPSTESYEGDRAGYWAVYWHVAELKQLATEDYRPISSLQSEKTGKFWKAGTPPRGPVIVQRPTWI